MITKLKMIGSNNCNIYNVGKMKKRKTLEVDKLSK